MKKHVVVGGQTHDQTSVAAPKATWLSVFTWPKNCVFLLVGYEDIRP